MSLNEAESNQPVYGINREYAAMIFMSIGTTFHLLGYIFANEHRWHPITTNLIRGFTTVLITYVMARRQSVDITFPDRHNLKWQVIRNGAILGTNIVYAGSQFYLPLPIAVTLMSTSPIFATIFDRIINKISLNKRQIFWLVIAFMGVLLTANGNELSFILTGNSSVENSSFENYFSQDPQSSLWAGLIMILFMCLHGFAIVSTKKLNDTTTVHINYFQGVLYVMANGIMLPFVQGDEKYHWPQMGEVIKGMVFMGIPITLGLLAFTYALLLTKNYGRLTPFMFTSILFSYMVSVLRYGEGVNIICLVGAGAIVIGIVCLVRSKDEKQAAK